MMRTSCAGMLLGVYGPGVSDGVWRRFAARASRGVSRCGELLHLRGPLSQVGWDARGVCAHDTIASQMQHTPQCGAGRASSAAMGGGVAGAVAGVGARGARGAASRPNGSLQRVHRGVYAVGGAVLPREGRWLAAVLAYGAGAVLSHVSAAVHWNLCATTRRARRSPLRRPGARSRGSACTALAPSMPRTPPPPRHPDHDDPPHAARHRRRRPRAPPRASAGAGRTPAALRPHSDPSTIARANGHRGTKRLAKRSRATRNGPAASWRAACASSPATTACPTRVQHLPRRPRPPRPRGRLLLPDAPPRRRDRRLGHPQAPDKPSKMTAPRTPPSPPPATTCSASPGASSARPHTVADRLKAIMRPAPAPPPRARGGPARA